MRATSFDDQVTQWKPKNTSVKQGLLASFRRIPEARDRILN